MNGSDIPDVVRALVVSHIHTLMGLESLLLLQTDRQRSWTAQDIARELRVDPVYVERELNAFCNSGLSAANRQISPNTFTYAPFSADLDAAVIALAEVYAQRRVSIIQMIFSRPADPIKTFADAFDFRKGKPDA